MEKRQTVESMAKTIMGDDREVGLKARELSQ
jgi:hypothetical protein